MVAPKRQEADLKSRSVSNGINDRFNCSSVDDGRQPGFPTLFIQKGIRKRSKIAKPPELGASLWVKITSIKF
jgi:hypothetical protein